MNPKIQKLTEEIDKITHRIKSLEARLIELKAQKDELEKTEIVEMVRSVSATPEELAAFIRAFRETENGRYLNIEVSDNGCGMDENTRNNAFLPFFTTKKDGTGTGIGLYIVNNLVQEMGGKITVQSEPGTGSTFRVSIPIQKV